MNPTFVVLATISLGFLTGLRAFTPLAFVSWMSIWGWIPLAGSHLWFLGTTTCAAILSFLAVAELIGDKLPHTPPRIRPAPLIVRIINGALSATALCVAGGQHWTFGILWGALGAIGGSFGGYQVRRFLVRGGRIPDLVVALTEDFVTIAGTLFVLRQYFSAPV